MLHAWLIVAPVQLDTYIGGSGMIGTQRMFSAYSQPEIQHDMLEALSVLNLQPESGWTFDGKANTEGMLETLDKRCNGTTATGLYWAVVPCHECGINIYPDCQLLAN
jgi:hypothetical protein